MSQIIFADHLDFTPNLTPKEMFQAGIFGGTYFRPIHSSITGEDYADEHKEFPADRFAGIVVDDDHYDKKRNKYNIKCGTSLEFREHKWWIKAQDPYGRVQRYCRFYLGRRTADDDRQIKRRKALAWPTGRFKNHLIKMLRDRYTHYDDPLVSPKIRQVLLHWAYEITQEDVRWP